MRRFTCKLPKVKYKIDKTRFSRGHRPSLFSKSTRYNLNSQNKLFQRHCYKPTLGGRYALNGQADEMPVTYRSHSTVIQNSKTRSSGWYQSRNALVKQIESTIRNLTYLGLKRDTLVFLLNLYFPLTIKKDRLLFPSKVTVRKDSKENYWQS